MSSTLHTLDRLVGAVAACHNAVLLAAQFVPNADYALRTETITFANDVEGLQKKWIPAGPAYHTLQVRRYTVKSSNGSEYHYLFSVNGHEYHHQGWLPFLRDHNWIINDFTETSVSLHTSTRSSNTSYDAIFSINE
jgi:hypothetical protein